MPVLPLEVTTKRSTLPQFKGCVYRRCTVLASGHTETHVSYLQTMALNMTTPTELLSLFLPLIKREHVRLSEERRASNYGLSGIINVSSLSAFMPIPSMALYAATKVSISAPKG